MRKLFFKADIKLSYEQENQLFNYFEFIVKHNKELDLTRITNFDDIIVKHFIDSIIISKYIKLPSHILDIGTGAGFPGIPLKIFLPELDIILAEPRHKRVAFLNMIIDELKLTGVSIYPHMVTEKSFFNVNGVITRALESIDETLSRVSHFLPLNGRVIFMKGPKSEMDINSISDRNKDVYVMDSDMSYRLPGTNHARRLLSFNKKIKTLKKTYKIFINSNENVGMEITSKDNSKYKLLKRLTTIDGIKQNNMIIVSGKKQIKELIEKDQDNINYLIIFDGLVIDDDYLNLKITELNLNKKLLILKKSLFNELDIFKTESILLVANVPDLKQWDYTINPGCNLVVPFQDPVNVGAVIRSAIGLNVNKIILLKETANPYHPKSIRSSAGTVFNAEIVRGPSIDDLYNIVIEHNIQLVGLDKNGKDIKTYKFPESFILLPGLEGPGLPEAFKGKSISIPISSKIESLNTAIAASIAMYEWRRE